MIDVKHLSKSFGRNLVLDDISEHIYPGEKVVIIGPSGSGKSTFLRCLNLLETPTSGSISFEETEITNPKTDIDKIRRTLEETSREDFKHAVDAIVEAENIYVIGAKSAATLARFITYYFNLMFVNVKLVHTTSSSEMFEQIMRIGKKDILIGISFPRYLTQTVKAFKYAKGNGATVIAITDSPASPLAEDADHLLLARSDMASFVDSLVAPLSLINALIVAVGLKKRQDIFDTFEKLETIWDRYEVYDKSDREQDSDES